MKLSTIYLVELVHFVKILRIIFATNKISSTLKQVLIKSVINH